LRACAASPRCRVARDRRLRRGRSPPAPGASGSGLAFARRPPGSSLASPSGVTGRTGSRYVSAPGRTATSPRRAAVVELVELVVDRLEADPQLGGGGGLAAAVLLQHPEQVLDLDLLERPRRVAVGGLRGAGDDGPAPQRRQVLGGDDTAARDDERP